VPIKAQDSADAAAEQLERTGSAAAAGINSARLIQTMSESEMRVGMHSAEFGDISIRTSVSQQQLTAQISVDHSELGSAISAHLPSLQSKLGSEFGPVSYTHLDVYKRQSSSLSSSSLESTFLNLLVTELQNQDPTQPVDPTEMVGQMVSLNQLDQLISINQTLSNLSSGSSTTASTASTSRTLQQTASNAANPAASATTTPAATSAQLQATPYSAAGSTGLMNLYGSYVSPGATTKSMYTGVR